MYNHLKDLVLGAAPRPLLDSLPTAAATLSPKSAIDRAVSALYDLLGTRQTQASSQEEPIAVALAPMSSKTTARVDEWDAADEMMTALRATLQAKRSGALQDAGQVVTPEVASRVLQV